MNPVIQARELSRWYGMVMGLNNVSFDIAPGLTGLVGPNGAGKSTLIQVITGQLQPSAGTLTVFGEVPWNNPALLQRIGFCPEREAVPKDLRPMDWLTGLARLSGLDAAEIPGRCEAILDKVKLSREHWSKTMGQYSKGMKQRVKLAQGMLHEPDLLVLDEPMNGLDPMGRQEIANLLAELAAGGASILISSHILAELESLCRNILILNWGRILASGSQKEIRGDLKNWSEELSIQCDDPEKLARHLFDAGILLGFDLDPAAGLLRIRVKDAPSFYPAWTGLLLDSGVTVQAIRSQSRSLQNIFEKVTARAPDPHRCRRGRSPPRGNLRLAPSFLKAWGGIWLFTWRTQLSWRRVPLMLVWLLILPFLIWVTVHSPQTWIRPDLPLGDPLYQVNRFSVRGGRSPPPSLNPQQRDRLVQIMRGEYDRAQNESRAASGPETSVADQKALIESCHVRIVEKARSELDDRQFAQFQALDKKLVANTEDQIGEPAWNRTAPFYRWLIDFYFFIILPLSCVRSCGGLIRDELQTDTLGFLTTRPVKRATLVVLKYLCQVAWLEMVVLAEGLLLLGAGALREIPELSALLPLFLAVQFLAVLAWSALGLFLGQVTKRYLPLALVYGLVVELGIGDIPTNINTLSLMRHLRTLLSHNTILQSIFEWTGTGVLLPVGALLLATALFVALASLLFTFREYHAANEMQK